MYFQVKNNYYYTFKHRLHRKMDHSFGNIRLQDLDKVVIDLP